ncbi:MAG: radical SAM protein [Candidatus Omnitrophica bacterium]|nr:radical SAM protein [Candidatus Omnitrophota bacterium]MCK5287476.1 radical SAM protein [Candidatus Omnitrophota bacterium]MCK5492395.1 radical SAM protein [Candidatus Omnitrophota bacterium]
MDDFKIEGHKLMYHVSRLNEWINGENVCPIYLEISPSGQCNHRCVFCAFDYLGYKSQFIDKNNLKKFLSEAAQSGVKSVLYSGEGEPLLHKKISEIIVYTKEVGIDVAITTNGVFLDEQIISECLPYLTWMRISLNAGTPKTYARVHRCNPDDFIRVIKNLEKAVKVKRENNYSCTIGVQIVMIPENMKELTMVISLLKDIGVDYLAIKPFSSHPMSKLSIDFDYDEYSCLADQLHSYSNKDFKVIFRGRTMKKLKEIKLYEHCLGISFFANIDACGDVYPCHAFVGNDKFRYGNIYKSFFSEIWQSSQRKDLLAWMSSEFNTVNCRKACRLDEINRYLWELKHPSPHINFI